MPGATRILTVAALAVLVFRLPLAAAPLSIAVFQVDVTPPVGAALCHGGVKPAASVADPLSARGVVLLGAGRPIVLVAVDWTGIANRASDDWRRRLAEAAGTTYDRVRVHTLHQHDAPGWDQPAAKMLEQRGLGGKAFNREFASQALERLAQAVAEAPGNARPLTHVGVGHGEVREVASNRRVPGPDGKVLYGRLSSCRIPEAIAAPEGVVDRHVKLISFWAGEKPVAVLTYYATHPQSYYGNGEVSADFVGMARAVRERALPGIAHIHFDGAGGNVAAGKYNDGSPERRPMLAARLADGMKRAWDSQVKHAILAGEIELRTVPVRLPIAGRLADRAKLAATLEDPKAEVRARMSAARHLSFLETQDARPIDLTAVRLGDAWIVHMPGELFVEYQLAAQKMRPDSFVAMAAYGDYGAGYIGTERAYSEGGYEIGASRTAPAVERVLLDAMQRLLK